MIYEERPGFWIEFLLFLTGGYLAGIMAILTCEHGLIRAGIVGLMLMFCLLVTSALIFKKRF
jgi:DMSO/TMAO reductase YedYZ heme-binding membrane subunit